MAAAVTSPTVDEAFDAALAGDVAIVKQFLDGGGNVDQGIESEHLSDDHSFAYPLGTTLLMGAAESGHIQVMKLLLAHNADMNVAVAQGNPGGYTALLSAVVVGQPDAVQLLLDSGVDTSTLLSHSEFPQFVIDYPRIVRILLAAGLDLTANIFFGTRRCTLDDHANECITRMHDLRHAPGYPSIKEAHTETVRAYTETVRILEGTRRAGSYKQWVLQGRGPYKKLLRLRSQVARGYATIGRGTPPVVARLFGLPGVPDPCFWLVVEYAWLGDWRRP